MGMSVAIWVGVAVLVLLGGVALLRQRRVAPVPATGRAAARQACEALPAGSVPPDSQR